MIKQTYHAIEIILINGGDIFSTDISDYLKNIEMPVTIMLDVLGDEIFELDFDANNVTELMSLVVNKKIDIGELTHSLSVEDEFSGNQELNVLDFYE